MSKKAWMLLPLILLSTHANAEYTGRSIDSVLNDYNIIQGAVLSFATLIGISLIGLSFFTMRKHSENPAQYPMKSAGFTFFAGICLLSVRFLIDAGGATLFQGAFDPSTQSAYLGIKEATVSQSNQIVDVNNNPGVLIFIGFSMLIGIIYFTKGVFLLHEMGKSGSGQGSEVRNKAIWHMIGGSLAYNVVDFACALSNTFGFAGYCNV